MSLPLALIPLLLFASPWRQAPGRVEHHRIGAWTVVAHRNGFSDRLACKVTARGMTYERGALVFHLPARVDTSAAVYRVDDGEPVTVRSELMDMAHLGFEVYRDDLTNPSGGVVRVPERRLAGAQVVRIQAGPKARVIRFKVAGLTAALDVARAAGCSPADFSRQVL